DADREELRCRRAMVSRHDGAVESGRCRAHGGRAPPHQGLALESPRASRGGAPIMLYWVTQQLTFWYSGFNVFSYLTFRAILATITALAFCLIVGPAMIARLSRYQIGQVVRTDGPKTHLPKAGTPTMGGALILVAVLVTT